jgi:hypothetical protein
MPKVNINERYLEKAETNTYDKPVFKKDFLCPDII